MAFATGRFSYAICDRCRLRRDYRDLVSDGNSPALRVCRPGVQSGCYDNLDPWRLAPKALDPMILRFPRPDLPDLGAEVPTYILTEQYVVLLTTEGNPLIY